MIYAMNVSLFNNYKMIVNVYQGNFINHLDNHFKKYV